MNASHPRERIREIKALAEKNPSLKRASCHACMHDESVAINVLISTSSKVDVYNPKKVKYWVEKKTSASMKAKQLVRESERTSYDIQTEADADGAVTVGRGLSFDIGSLDLNGPMAATDRGQVSSGIGGASGFTSVYVAL